MNAHARQNEAIMRYATTVPTGKSRSLMFGDTFTIGGLPEAKNVLDKTFYVSVFVEERMISIGEARTFQTVDTFNNIDLARKEARRLAMLWGFETTLEAISEEY